MSELFGGDPKANVTLTDGRTVNFRTAILPQTGAILKFFKMLVERVDGHELSTLLKLISIEQEKILAAGGSANDIKGQAIQAIKTAAGNQSLVVAMLQGTIDHLPDLVSAFCTLTPEEVNELDMENLTLTIIGVVAVNYSFFTRTLPPILASALSAWQQKQQSEIRSKVEEARAKLNAAQQIQSGKTL